MMDVSLRPGKCSVLRPEGGCRKDQKNVQGRQRDATDVTRPRCGHAASFAPEREQARVVC